ncbi:transcriptional regulator [Bacillus thuringiensis serovar pingluonsis]|uniref:Transcriptional regulator n=1 Tax=Bacillus thuringiensis serovar pingluonsis TaxID=180881 RepID=A0A243BMX4_BACTU|nr:MULTISPECIES: helix-turn-helix domain-containing protein [Bacillus]MRB24549.1 metalloregulator ArsR/SmtB family transcription factor [Bacillus thuringiensis]MDA2309430.1 helix-turn-helix domain-containing protein [Bacillus cereus]MDA2316740.1 helix-turn-helix domain-containing protein [Bacillus cereus]MDA2498344.1 helix-turn-helix domain-containing protein [Bacillus cereus]MDF9610671.1 helix-turn-helix domain-containing protein [Bacillus cereus]
MQNIRFGIPLDYYDKKAAILFFRHNEFYRDLFQKMGQDLDFQYINLLNRIKKIKSLDNEFLDFYFSSLTSYEEVINGNIYCIATTIIKAKDIFDKDSSEIYCLMNSMDEDSIRLNIINTIKHLTNKKEGFEANQYYLDENHFYELLSNSSVTSNNKWGILKAFKNPHSTVVKYINIMQKIDSDLTNAFSELKNGDYVWFEKIKELPIAYFIKIIEMLKGTEYYKNQIINIFPTITPYLLSISKEENNIYLGIGIKSDQFFLENGSDDDLDNLQEILKTLADGSKLSILLLLKDKKLYAGELAKELSLSNATISHHMRIMSIQGLVESERIQNKTYYYLNKKCLSELLKKLNSLLLL